MKAKSKVKISSPTKQVGLDVVKERLRICETCYHLTGLPISEPNILGPIGCDKQFRPSLSYPKSKAGSPKL